MICKAAHSASEAGQVAARLAVHVEHEAADRHGRIRAIVDQLVPVGVAKLGDVLPERVQQILRVPRRQAAALAASRAAPRPSGSSPPSAQQARFEAIEPRELLVSAKRRVIGDIVGDADEFVERENDRPVPALDQPGGDREILVPRALAGPKLRAVGHGRLGALTCTRPFHWPPRRRKCR